MRKIHLFLVLAFTLSTQSVFADMMSTESKSCDAVKKACMDAGYKKDNGSKKFWMDCMKPVLMGQTVKDVKVDSDTVKSCRTDKIADLKQMLNDLENVQ